MRAFPWFTFIETYESHMSAVCSYRRNRKQKRRGDRKQPSACSIL
jgi:hypothetical protein